jgi:S1-C subfamily serine protease
MRLWIFIEGIAVFAAAWAFGARAQQSGMPTVCGSIGVQVRPMTAAFAYSLGMTEIYGAIFRQPKRGGPAAMAGIEAGDVVTAINGSPLSNWRNFAPTISMMAPGQPFISTLGGMDN